jgi:hypothetical protein
VVVPAVVVVHPMAKTDQCYPEAVFFFSIEAFDTFYRRHRFDIEGSLRSRNTKDKNFANNQGLG